MILAHSIESDSIETAVPNNALLTALAKAYAWQEQLESGQFEGLESPEFSRRNAKTRWGEPAGQFASSQVAKLAIVEAAS